MKNLQIFNYNDTPVGFQTQGDDLMVNATQIARLFKKRPGNWLSTQQAIDLTASLSAKTGIPVLGLVVVNHGGKNKGTWMHEDLVLLFAQWLSPEFYLWCNDRIKELIRFGLTATDEMLEMAEKDPEYVAVMTGELKKSRARTIELEAKHKELVKQLEENAPKVAYYEQLQNTKESFEKKRTYPVSKLAHTLGLKPDELNKLLLKRGVIGKVDGNWYMMPNYENQGYAIEKETMSKRYNEETDRMEMMPSTYLVWTAKGRDLIFSLFEKL